MRLRRVLPYLGLVVLLVVYANLHTIQFEHIFLLTFMLVLGLVSSTTRRFLVAVAPLIAFGWIYSFMNVFTEHAADNVTVETVYRIEQTLFGWMAPGAGSLGPVDFFRQHHHIFFDFLGGTLYALHIPAIIAFGIYLWFRTHRGEEDEQERHRLHAYMWGFLAMGATALAIQALFPVAPPWYVEKFGMTPPGEPVPGDPAALARVDSFLGISYFQGVYAKNSYVFGALPSLHVASPVWLALNIRHRVGRIFAWGFALAMGLAAVYLTHHYVVDVVAGGALSVLVYALFSGTRMRRWSTRLYERLFEIFFRHEADQIHSREREGRSR